jgi:hypothetical protein
MADSLYLSLWYPNLRIDELGDKLLRVLLQFAKYGGEDRVYSATVWPFNWSESPVFQRVYRSVTRATSAESELKEKSKNGPQLAHDLLSESFSLNDSEPTNPLGDLKVTQGIDPAIAIAEALENLHDDYAYEFQIGWSLWELDPEPSASSFAPRWLRQPRLVRVTAFGPLFDDGAYEQDGHIRIDFGPDTPFLEEDAELDDLASRHVEENLRHLIELAHAAEKSSGATARLLWSELGESLALRLMQRLNVGN